MTHFQEVAQEPLERAMERLDPPFRTKFLREPKGFVFVAIAWEGDEPVPFAALADEAADPAMEAKRLLDEAKECFATRFY